MAVRFILAFLLAAVMRLSASAAWKDFTSDNYVCGPKLTEESLKGKVVLVDMWATWCGPCQKMLPHTDELARKYKRRSLVVVGSHVADGYSKESVERLVKSGRYGFSFYRVAGWDGDVGFDGGIPFLYVVDRKGCVVYGGRDLAAVEKAIESALAQPGGDVFLDEAELVGYKSLKGKLAPGKPVEQILKRLESDVAKADKNPNSETFAKLKKEALAIIMKVDEYKADLLKSIESEIAAGEVAEAGRHIDLLVATWPSLKKEWTDRKRALTTSRRADAAVRAAARRFDLGELFRSPDAWSENAVDFAVEHAKDGFRFASQKRDIVNCLDHTTTSFLGFDVWESRIYYGDDGVGLVEMSLYNRGDNMNGKVMGHSELKDLLERVIKKADPSDRVGIDKAECRKVMDRYQYSRELKTSDFRLEISWGVDSAKRKELTVDYVRVSMLPPDSGAAAKSPGSGRGAAELVRRVSDRVRRNDAGDVWIENVPMVDQGRKGYCAAAVSERVLRYFGQQIDEHQIAQVAGTSARGGTDVGEMREAVRAIGRKCNLDFEDVVSMAGSVDELQEEVRRYNKVARSMKEDEMRFGDFVRGNVVHVSEIRAAMRPKVLKRLRTKDPRYGRFMTGVRTQIDRGVPVIWGVTLGYYPEPGLEQSSGGHMRLVVGYNAKTDEILYSDTWGAGHELKRMPSDWAFTITHDAFFLKPR